MHTCDEAVDDDEERNCEEDTCWYTITTQSLCFYLAIFQKPAPESSLLPKSEDSDQERRLVSGTKAKNEILEKYQAQFGSSSGKPIVSTKKGELSAPITSSNIPSHGQIVQSSMLKPTKDASYMVDGLMLHNIITPVLVQRRS